MVPLNNHQPECRYVREVNGKWEYGVFDRETRKHLPRGTRPSMDAALKMNRMALEGQNHLDCF